MTESEQKYADIINMPHHTSKTRPRMTMINRAAQFSPFAALTGQVKEIDAFARIVKLEDGTKIPIQQIYGIESELFTELGYE